MVLTKEITFLVLKKHFKLFKPHSLWVNDEKSSYGCDRSAASGNYVVRLFSDSFLITEFGVISCLHGCDKHLTEAQIYRPLYFADNK